MAVNINYIIGCIVVTIIRILTIIESVAGITEVHMHTHIDNVHTRELAMIRCMVVVSVQERIGRSRLVSCTHYTVFILIHFKCCCCIVRTVLLTLLPSKELCRVIN
ncbi:hypothetical protein D1872_252830 [compost metagenome]